MHSVHQFFLHEMSDMLDAEEKLVEALGEMAEETTHPKLKQAIAAHQQQTEGQAERLRQAFQILDEEPEETECAGIKGLKEEHDNFKEEDPAEPLINLFNIGAGIKTENYEISAYRSLISLAEGMGHNKVVRLLQQNLREEEQTLQKMQRFQQQLSPEELGIGTGMTEAEEEGLSPEESREMEREGRRQARGAGRKQARSASAGSRSGSRRTSARSGSRRRSAA